MVPLFLAGVMCSGCAALVPLSSLISMPSAGAPPLQVHQQSSVELAKNNFVIVRTNVVGRSRGFSLLGIIIIHPATLTKAMNRMYDAAGMRTGSPQAVANLVVENSNSYYILFGIPEVDARADIVEFRSEPAKAAIMESTGLPLKPPDEMRQR
jgi:hypothetical protein